MKATDATRIVAVDQHMYAKEITVALMLARMLVPLRQKAPEVKASW